MAIEPKDKTKPKTGRQKDLILLAASKNTRDLSQALSPQTAEFELLQGFPGGTSGKEPACQCRRHKRHGFDPWVGKIPWRRHGNPLQYSCPENPMDRGAWWATVHTVAKSQTQLKRLSMHARICLFVKGICCWSTESKL